jgi:hypothetical protein
MMTSDDIEKKAAPVGAASMPCFERRRRSRMIAATESGGDRVTWAAASCHKITISSIKRK